MIDCYRLVIFIPKDDLEDFVKAIQDAIPSFVGNYDRVMWWNDPQIEYGTGQFRPLKGANPAEGSVGETERIEDIRIEFLAPHDKEKIEEMIEKIIRPAHPFEEPVIYIYDASLYSDLKSNKD